MSEYAYGLGASLFPIVYLLFKVGNLDGFTAQNIVPLIKDATGSTVAPMVFPAACLTAAGLLVIMTARITAGRIAREGTSFA